MPQLLRSMLWRRWTLWAGAVLVVAVTIATFLPTLKNGFVNWDDAKNFLANPNYRGLGWANLRWLFTTAHMGHYIPVTWLTLALDYVLWGMNPAGYHLTAVALHALNALLVYVIAYRLLDAGFEQLVARVHLSAGAVTAALLFAVHPLRVESVAWISERRDVVAGLFSLLTVLAYLTAWRRGPLSRLHPSWYWAAVGCFALACLSKSIVVGLPLVLLVIDWYPLRRTRVGATRGLLLEKAPFVFMSAVGSAVMLQVAARQEVMTTLDALGVAQRLAIAGYGLGFYLWKAVAPWPLSPFYELHYPVLPLAFGYVFPSAGVLALSASLVLARRRWPAGLAAWLTYVLLLVPVIGIFHNGYQIAADRYTYLACLGWALLAGAGVAWSGAAARRGALAPRPARLLVALAVTVIVALAGLSTLQIRVWRTSETLWQHALARDPQSAFAHFHLGSALLAAGGVQDARREYEQAVALLPDRLPTAKAVFHALLGALLQGQEDLAGAERHYRAALRFSEDNVIARNNLGVIQGRQGDLQGALDSFVRVLRVVPGYPSACRNGQRVAALLMVSPKEFEGCPPAGEAQELVELP